MTPKIPGIADDVDVVALATAFNAFNDAVYLMADASESMEVDLAFQTVYNKKTYNFEQDELVRLNKISIDPVTCKMLLSSVYGSRDKFFTMDEAELVSVNSRNDEGHIERHKLSSTVDDILNDHFAEFGVSHSGELRSMLKASPALVKVFNDSNFVEKHQKSVGRVKAYATLEKYGRY